MHYPDTRLSHAFIKNKCGPRGQQKNILNIFKFLFFEISDNIMKFKNDVNEN